MATPKKPAPKGPGPQPFPPFIKKGQKPLPAPTKGQKGK